jgi:hypothetical protein
MSTTEPYDVTRTPLSQFDRARAWGTERPQVSLGAAIMLTLCTSVAAALFARRRAQARARKLAWLLLAGRNLSSAVPTTRQTGAFGGAGGALLVSALMLARARASRSHTRMDDLHERLAMLQAQIDRHRTSERQSTRDLLLGAAVALGLVGLIGRIGSGRHAS